MTVQLNRTYRCDTGLVRPFLLEGTTAYREAVAWCECVGRHSDWARDGFWRGVPISQLREIAADAAKGG